MIFVSKMLGIGKYLDLSGDLKYSTLRGFVLDFENSTGGIMGYHYFKVGIL